jgi:hypothetical protein
VKRPLNLLYNFHWVADGAAARSAQPYLGGWRRFLAGNGVRAVVNLRGAHPEWHWWRRETAVCAEQGVAHFDVAFNSRRLPTRARLMTILGFLAAAPRPVLIKCSGGQDRTSFVAALFILHTDGWDGWEKAVAHFSRFPYLHFPKRHQRWLRRFFDFARERAQGRPIADWIAESYDPDAFAAWLAETGLADGYKAVRPAGQPRTSI